MNQTDALGAIAIAIDKLSSLRSGKPGSADHVEFVQTTGMDLGRMFGADSPITMNFSAITYRASGTIMTHPMTYAQDMARRSMGAYQSGLDAAEGILRSATEQLQRYGLDQLQAASRVRADGAKVFISHGRETAALARIERYVRALGLMPIIVVHGASEGMSVDTLVETRMVECSCAIILATADDQVDTYWQPRPNVIHEIGLAQEKLNNRIIYLKEEGCDFPSNVRPKVWENFTQENLEPAFEKIAKELRAFGLL